MPDTSQPLSAFPEANRITAVPTKDRSKLGRGYYVIVSRETKKALGLGRMGALVFAHPALRQVVDERKIRDYLAIHCRVRVDKAMSGPADQVCVDQTLRNALGIPFTLFPLLTRSSELTSKLPLYLFPARRSWTARLRVLIASIFGIRFVAARSAPSAVADIEKGYARLPEDLLSVMGALPADNVVVERPVATGDLTQPKFRIIAEHLSSAVASKAFIDDRIKRAADSTPPPGKGLLPFLSARGGQLTLPRRYPDTRKLLYHFADFEAAGLIPAGAAGQLQQHEEVEPDIPPIFMDYDARCKGVPKDAVDGPADYLTPFMVRRSILSAAARDSIGTAFTVTISVIQFAFFFFADKSDITRWQWIAGICVASALSLSLMVARLRQQV